MRVLTTFNLNILVLSIFLTGCIVQSRQLNGLLELIKEPSIDLSESGWLVTYADHESIVFAVSIPNGVLFSNNAGDQIFFDGWTVREVRGMGHPQLRLRIFDGENARVFKKGNVAISSHSCDQWEREKSAGVVRYTEYCGGIKRYKNSILVDEDGDISMIRQIVDERYTALTLTKLK